jgi:hypothetical protein
LPVTNLACYHQGSSGSFDWWSRCNASLIGNSGTEPHVGGPDQPGSAGKSRVAVCEQVCRDRKRSGRVSCRFPKRSPDVLRQVEPDPAKRYCIEESRDYSVVEYIWESADAPRPMAAAPEPAKNYCRVGRSTISAHSSRGLRRRVGAVALRTRPR